MPSNADIILWAVTTLAEAFAVYIFVLWGIAREFRFFTGYLVFSLTKSVASYVVLQQYGFLSQAYAECYWTADVLGTIILFASVGELASRTARSAWLAKQMVEIFVGGFAAALLLSIAEIPIRIMFEVSEKLFWLSGVFVFGLCIWNFRNTDWESRKRWVAFRLANVVGVYFFLNALAYASFYLAQGGRSFLGGLASAWLPIGASLVAISARPSTS